MFRLLLNAPSQESGKPLSNKPATLPRLVLEGFLSRGQLAEQLGLSERTIARWEALRDAPPRTQIGRRVFYNIQSVRLWLQAREQQPSAVRKRRGGSP